VKFPTPLIEGKLIKRYKAVFIGYPVGRMAGRSSFAHLAEYAVQ